MVNWNGEHKNGVLADIIACREGIKVTKQRGSNAEWLLAQVDPKENKAALIGLVVALTAWADEQEAREEWLMWAMQHRSDKIRAWMGYKQDWSMMPAAVRKRSKEVVRLTHKGVLPDVYLLPCMPKNTGNGTLITLETGLEIEGIELATVTYVKWDGKWYKVFYPKTPSKSAVSRAMRLYLTSVLVGRDVFSTNDLMVYEMLGLKGWLLQDGMVADHASRALFRILTDPGTEEHLLTRT